MKSYKARIVDSILQKKLSSSGAVLIEGAKWCGKTTTATQIAKSVLYMQDPVAKNQNLQMAEINPSLLLQGDTPRLIDEWQLAPKLWDSIRFEVDKRDDFSQFILTGSSVPVASSDITHSGVGRISRMLMRPMSLYESGESNGSVSLYDLFNNVENISGYNNLTIEDISYLICRGGWPKSIGVNIDVALQLPINYYEAIVMDDISRVDNVKRDSEKIKRILRSYARSIATQTKISTITQDVYANDNYDNLNNKNITISSYISALKKIFVIEDSLSWNPNLRSKTAIRSSDTRYFTDPSVATAALGLGPNDLINDLEAMGLLFENLCIRDLRVYAESLDGQIYHYRDKNNLECDAVIHLRNGQYGLIEIKLGGDKLIADGVTTLNQLEKNIDTTKMNTPSFKMVLVAVGDYAYRRKDGIYIVPIGALKD